MHTWCTIPRYSAGLTQTAIAQRYCPEQLLFVLSGGCNLSLACSYLMCKQCVIVCLEDRMCLPCKYTCLFGGYRSWYKWLKCSLSKSDTARSGACSFASFLAWPSFLRFRYASPLRASNLVNITITGTRGKQKGDDTEQHPILDPPFPVPHLEKKVSSATMNGLLSPIGMQYLWWKVIKWWEMYGVFNLPYNVHLIPQFLCFRAFGNKISHFLQFEVTTSFKSTGIMENETGITSKYHLVLNIMMPALDNSQPSTANLES